MDNIFLKVVKHPEKIVYGLERKGLLDWLSEKDYIKITYRLAFGRKLNLDDPRHLQKRLIGINYIIEIHLCGNVWINMKFVNM